METWIKTFWLELDTPSQFNQISDAILYFIPQVKSGINWNYSHGS